MSDYLSVYIEFIAQAVAASALFYSLFHFSQKSKEVGLSKGDLGLGIIIVAVLVGTVRILCVLLFGGKDYVALEGGFNIVFSFLLPLALAYFVNKRIKEKNAKSKLY